MPICVCAKRVVKHTVVHTRCAASPHSALRTARVKSGSCSLLCSFAGSCSLLCSFALRGVSALRSPDCTREIRIV